VYLRFSILSSFFLFGAVGSKGWKEKEEEGGGLYPLPFFVSSAIGVAVLLDHLHHYLDGDLVGVWPT